MRTLGVIQARMGSERLRGKVLTPLAGRTVLSRVVRAVRESGAIDGLVVATTVEGIDDAVAQECERLGVDVYRGPVDDVLTRFLGVLAEHPADAIMRFTADCPLLDPEIIATGVKMFHAAPGIDYLSTSIVRTLPRGLDVEIIRADTLRALDGMVTDFHRTHVTSYVYSHPDQFRIVGLTLPPDRSSLRLTLDTPEDLRLLEEIVAYFGDTSVSLQKMIEWLSANPEMAAINAHIEQKALNQG